MKKPDLTKYKTTSTLYLLILIIAAVALVFGWQCTSYSLSNHSADLHIQMLPSRRVKVSKATTVYRISDVRWTKKASTLMFYSQHQTVVVEADGKLLYTRSLKTDSILHTTGRNCEMVSVPENTRSILVTLTNCNLDKQVSDPVFYQGDGVHMFRHELLKAGIPMLLGIMNVVLGILMLIYWLFVHHWAYVSKSMLYLGILTTDLGAWFCLETSSSILLSQNPVFHSYVTRMLLLLLPIPFMMFVRHYLKARDRYLCRIFVWLDVAEIAVVLFLQLMDIRDLTQTLWMTHVMIGLAVLYFIYTICNKFYHHTTTHALWICTIGIIILIGALFSDMFNYYQGAQDIGPAGRIAMLLFIVTLACDTAFVSLKEIDAGRRAALYRELAEKDLLTGCYNRNAYHEDTSRCKKLTNLLLFAFDLNNLKYYNDKFGHDCGDQYITDASHILRKIFSRYGKLYRIGGDEFCVLIDDHNTCDISHLICCLRKEEAVYNASSRNIHLQIACGYAVFDSRTDADLDALQKRADQNMYENKKQLKTFSYR